MPRRSARLWSALGLVALAACSPEFEAPSRVAGPPAVVIQAPADQATFTDADAIGLQALVDDGNGLSDIVSVRWSSNLQGPLGVDGDAMPDDAGLSRLTVLLASGIHAVEVEVEDSDGLVATDAITLRITQSDVMPVAEIVDPTDQEVFDLGASVALLGLVHDPNQDADTLFARWTAVSVSTGAALDLGDGESDGDGNVSGVFVDPAEDVWIVGLEVTDDDDNLAIARIQITVRDPLDLDGDLDGWSTNGGDCDDADPDVFPGNPETCDGRDNDCNATIDDKDVDADQHVDLSCTSYPGPLGADDCDDLDEDVFPGAVEVPDGVDQDCDGPADEGTVRFDDDGDCFCEGPQACSGSVEIACAPDAIAAGDCDDADALVSPADFDLDGASACAGDCDDRDPARSVADLDGDGSTTCAGDCDDDPTGCGAGCFPGNPVADACDGRDQDCEGGTDEDPDVPWYPDLDLDGATHAPGRVLACADPDGAGLQWLPAATVGDCDDTVAALNQRDDDGDGFPTCGGDCDDDAAACGADCFPGNAAADVCDGRNQDCDGGTDEDPEYAWFHDADADGFTNPADFVWACADPDAAASAWVAAATVPDCDDDPAACGAGCFPGNAAADVCDAANQDCDASVDEDPEIAWHHDLDGDGFTAGTTFACADPDGLDVHWLATATTPDCDDSPASCGAACWPGNPAADVCDGRNQDCDASVDENPDLAWYRDQDGDTWTAATGSTLACADPDGAVGGWLAAASTPTDCDDTSAAKNHDDDDDDTWDTCEGDCDDDPVACGADCFPGNADPDVCDDANQDCDGSVDENPDVPWYRDQDGDGHTLAVVGQYACDDPDGGLTGWLAAPTTGGDCDDDPAACGAACWPGNPAADVCDGRNQDCDALFDENPNVTWYHDADGDSYTNNTDTVLACADPDGALTAWKGTPTVQDCDDNPAACGAGCYPGNAAADVCDGRNQDCDASVDENPNLTWYRDQDGDTWTAATGSTLACADPDGPSGGWLGGASNPTDCNDTSAALEHDDDDGDGWDTCEGDCNDASAALNLTDGDGDGWDTCEGDCNDASGAVRPGLADTPDTTYTDQNCDGIDGTVTAAVFVATTGSDTSSCGTMASPCRTVQYAGATRAPALGRTDLYIQAGNYTGVQAWSGLSGIKVWGGYNGSWVRGSRTVAGYQVTFSGGTTSNQGVGLKITSSTLSLDNVIVQSPNASGQDTTGTQAGKGRSSYGVHVKDSTLSVTNTTFSPGSGSAGLGGSNGSSAANTPAGGGGRGTDADDAAYCCNDTTRLGGGTAGTNASCPTGTAGGAGGAGGKLDTNCGCSFGICTGNCDATSGLNGSTAAIYATSSYGWYGGGGGREQPGGNGRAGRTLDGSGGGAGSMVGALAGDWWYGGNGGNGTVGADGTGGGGGGGSGGSDDNIDDWGAGGGGGGAGGCMAPAAGTGGRAGGSSFALFAINSTIDVRNSQFNYGNGGNGGAGGSGGTGQPGGSGGSGGSSFESAQPGGSGGAGARGGHAGGGGGGAGGSTYGMYVLGGSLFQTGNNGSTTGSAGGGGAAGTTGISGTAGQAGEKVLSKTCPAGGC